MSNFYKQNQITLTLGHLATFYGQQSRELRNLENSVPWELKQIKDGGIYHHPRLTMTQTRVTKKFACCGIEVGWQAVPEISLHSPRVSMSNDFADCLFGLTTALVSEEAGRNIVFTHGWPKRFTLLLHDDSRQACFDEVKLDIKLHADIAAIGAPWSERMTRRSLFVKLTVLQITLAIELETFLWTPRLHTHPDILRTHNILGYGAAMFLYKSIAFPRNFRNAFVCKLFSIV